MIAFVCVHGVRGFNLVPEVAVRILYTCQGVKIKNRTKVLNTMRLLRYIETGDFFVKPGGHVGLAVRQSVISTQKKS
jgi:hypothetical protein